MDSDGTAKLAKEQEARYQWYGEVALPGFMREPPPPFHLEPRTSSLRVLAFGDFGFGNEAQRRTAAAMVAYHKQHPFDFGITLGDNFYTYGHGLAFRSALADAARATLRADGDQDLREFRQPRLWAAGLRRQHRWIRKWFRSVPVCQRGSPAPVEVPMLSLRRS